MAQAPIRMAPATAAINTNRSIHVSLAPDLTAPIYGKDAVIAAPGCTAAPMA